VVFVFLFALLFVSPLRAEKREYWRHSKGHFENTKGNKWIEKASDGMTYRFIEQTRKEKYVELFDKSRDCYVRLYADHCEVKSGDGDFVKLFDGKWGGKK